MKKIISIGFFLTFLIGLSGCQKDYTVQYWNEHKNERNEYLKKCSNGDVDRNSQNCENARLSKHSDSSAGFFKTLNDKLKEKQDKK